MSLWWHYSCQSPSCDFSLNVGYSIDLPGITVAFCRQCLQNVALQGVWHPEDPEFIKDVEVYRIVRVIQPTSAQDIPPKLKPRDRRLQREANGGVGAHRTPRRILGPTFERTGEYVMYPKRPWFPFLPPDSVIQAGPCPECGKSESISFGIDVANEYCPKCSVGTVAVFAME